jgi:hypothetical protein
MSVYYIRMTRGNALEYVLTKTLQERNRTITQLQKQVQQLQSCLASSERDYQVMLEWTFEQGFIICDDCGQLAFEETGMFCDGCNNFTCEECPQGCVCYETSESETESGTL